MITGIAWIGASFYFIWLDNHLEAPKATEDTEKGVSGELWSVHGGGMYHAQKYQLAPAVLPDTLHWFKWEAYTTWISGMFMLALMYWYGAEIYLIDPRVAELSKPVAIRALKVAVIVGTALALINHGEKLLALSISLQDSVKIILSYLVPYGVSTWSAVGAIKEGFSDND